VQGLDRYAYVRNSPLVYTDPTGNKEDCGSDPQCPNDAPEEVSGELSTVPGQKTGISGTDLYELYLKLWNNKKAWYWEDGFFTLEDFIALILYKEAQGVMMSSDYPGYQEAWGRGFNTWCKANPSICSGGSTSASVLNYLAVASDSAEGLVANPAAANEPYRNWRREVIPLSAAMPMVEAFSNIEWQQGCIGNRPCYVGNLSLFSVDMTKVALKRPWFYTLWGTRPPNGNPMIILTLCQSYYWWGGYWAPGGNKLFRQDYPKCTR
jgi:hypothetical protein